MAKPEQVLIIDPQSELKFQGPFNRMVSAYINLENPTSKTVYFKIKTTAPKKYCVRPNAGMLLPNEKTAIHVCLQPFDFDPNEKCKHKFMVQTVISQKENENPDRFDEMWKDVKPENLMDTKLRCVFEYPVESVGSQYSETKGSSSPQTVSAATLPANLGIKEERKSIGDSPNTADGELMKVTKEVKQLREEETHLRQENLKLKELVLQLDRKLDSQDLQSNRSQAQASPLSQTPLIVLAILSGLIGIILGKFLL